jgi:hypothetical protein
VARITAFADGSDSGGPVPDEVPDPYYGGPDGFRDVFDLLEAACDGILAHAETQLTSATIGDDPT